jgi:hypothetical protein
MDQYPGMEMGGFTQTCRSCRRTFAHLTAFGNHLANCVQKKRKLANALAVAQHTYKERKRQRLENSAKMATEIEPSNLSPTHISSPTLPGTSVRDFLLPHLFYCSLLYFI